MVRSTKIIEAAEAVDDVWRATVECMQLHGIDHIIYVTVASAPPPNPFVLSTMPEEWSRRFQGIEDVFDPFLEYCCATYEVTRTGAAFLDDYPYLDETSKMFIQAANEVGFHSGLGIPMRLTGAPRYGGFNLGTSYSRSEFEMNVTPIAEQLRAFCLITHRRIEELMQDDRGSMSLKKLSDREKQCLTLLAGGLKVPAIAHHLDLSEAAIRLYVRNARGKLNASTREEAVAIAMAHNFLES